MKILLHDVCRIGRLLSSAGVLLLVACSFATSPNPVPSAPRVVLEADQPVEGLYRADDATVVAYEYTWSAASALAAEKLDMRFDLRSSGQQGMDLRLLVLNEEGRPVFTSLLFESDGSVMSGSRVFSIDTHLAHAFTIVAAPAAAARSRVQGDGIVLIEGERITGTLERWANTPAAVRYTYTYRAANASSAGVLNMEFALINGEVFSDMTLELVVVGEGRKYIAGGLLFERRNRRAVSADVRAFRMEPYGALAFDFVGGGFKQNAVPRQAF